MLGNYVYAEINLFFLGAKKNAIMIFRLLVLGAMRWAQPPNWLTVWDTPTSRWDSWPWSTWWLSCCWAGVRRNYDYHRQSADGSDPVFVAEQAGLPGVLEATSEREAAGAAGVTSLRRSFGLWTYFCTPDPASPTSRAIPSNRVTWDVSASDTGPLGVCTTSDEGPRDGKPVLLHGEPTWSYLYCTMIPPLAVAGHRVLALSTSGFGCPDKPTRPEDYTHLRHVEWVMSWLTQLDLREITAVQDWGSLIGLRVAAEQSDRFAKLFIANGFLQTGTGPPTGHSWIWRAFARYSPWFTASRIVNTGTVHELSAAVRAGWRRAVPRQDLSGRARAFPQLVPTSPDDPAALANALRGKHWAAGRSQCCAYSVPTTRSSEGDGPLIRHIPGAAGQPHARIKAGHFIQEDAGPELVQRLLDWKIPCDLAHKTAYPPGGVSAGGETSKGAYRDPVDHARTTTAMPASRSSTRSGCRPADRPRGGRAGWGRRGAGLARHARAAGGRAAGRRCVADYGRASPRAARRAAVAGRSSRSRTARVATRCS